MDKIEDTVETLLVNAEPGTGDKQLKDYYEKHREHGLPGLSQTTIERLEEHYRQHPTRRRLEEVVAASEKAKPPKGPAVALSTTCP